MQEYKNPFVGLRPYNEDEDTIFFGRDEQVKELLHKLGTTRFLGIIGSSGCGKSSIIRAGLIPKLKGGFLTGDRDHWAIATMMPKGNPLNNIANSILEIIKSADKENKTIRSLAGILEIIEDTGSYGILDLLNEIFKNSRYNILLLIDQFEELFTTRREGITIEKNKKENALFIQLMIALCQKSNLPIYVIITMRSDYIGKCDAYKELPEILNKSQYLVPGLNKNQLQEIIELPIKLCNRSIEKSLLNTIISDSSQDIDQLPILQHCLMRTYGIHVKKPENENVPINIASYQKAGTLKNALSDHANSIYNSLPNDKERTITQIIFKCLSDLNSENEPVRRRQTISNIFAICGNDSGILKEEITACIEIFRNKSCAFLTPYTGQLSEETLIDISHESLMRLWDKLKQWIIEEQESARKFKWLCDNVVSNRNYLKGLDLQDALHWREKQNPNNDWALRYITRPEIVSYDKINNYINESVTRQAADLQKEEEIQNKLLDAEKLKSEAIIQKLEKEADELLLKQKEIEAKQKEEQAIRKEKEYNRKRIINRRIIISLMLGLMLFLAMSISTFNNYKIAEAQSIQLTIIKDSLKSQVSEQAFLLNQYKIEKEKTNQLEIQKLLNTANSFIAANEYSDTGIVFNQIRTIDNSQYTNKIIDSIKKLK